jgi:hypothetical protein
LSIPTDLTAEVRAVTPLPDAQRCISALLIGALGIADHR